MAYNPYSAVNAIYKLKGQWTDANNANNTEAKNSAVEKAKEYYEQLRKNDYGDVADELTASDYARAKTINDKWAKMGKTSAKDYLYSLGQSRGMSSSDIDKLIEWDDLTGEISFGGKKIGTPDSVVDGVSYFTDTAVLDNAFNDYISRSGTIRTADAAVKQENEKLFAKYNQEYEDLKNTNPFETETGKAILEKYDLAGLQGRDNEVASNAGANGGNIDSFAAANALRQQAALVNQGQMAALEAHQQKLDHARALLSDMGVNIDRVFNQEETAKNNDVARKSEQAAVTGYTPTEWSIQNDAFLKNFVDGEGKLKAEYYDTDFQKLINDAKASGNTELANKYAILRGLKIFGNFSEYGKYLGQGDIAYMQPQKTEAARQFDANAAYQDRALTAEQTEAAADRQNKLDLADKEAASALAQIEAQNQGVEDKGGTDPDGTDPDDDDTPGMDWDAFISYFPQESNGGATTLTDAQVKAWADKLNKALSDKYGSEFKAVESTDDGNYKSVGIATEYVIMSVLESDELTDAQKQYLLIDKFGVSLDTTNNMLKDPHYK